MKELIQLMTNMQEDWAKAFDIAKRDNKDEEGLRAFMILEVVTTLLKATQEVQRNILRQLSIERQSELSNYEGFLHFSSDYERVVEIVKGE